jgi:hypothetical protein
VLGDQNLLSTLFIFFALTLHAIIIMVRPLAD